MIEDHPWQVGLLASAGVMVGSFLLQLIIGVPVTTAAWISGPSFPLLIVPFYKLATSFEDPGPITRFILAACGNADYRRPPSDPGNERPGSKLR